MNWLLADFIAVMAYIRLTVYIGLLSFIVLAVYLPIYQPHWIARVMGIYFGVTFTNQLISLFVSRDTAQMVIAVAGTPLMIVLMAGLWLSMQRGKD